MANDQMQGCPSSVTPHAAAGAGRSRYMFTALTVAASLLTALPLLLASLLQVPPALAGRSYGSVQLLLNFASL